MRIVVTAADCERETFRCGGHGGQNVQKRDTGVRWRHRPSGAVGESREERSQLQNSRIAFRRMAEHPVFRRWAGGELAAREQGHRDLEAQVDAMLAPDQLRVEVGVGECLPGEAACVGGPNDPA